MQEIKEIVWKPEMAGYKPASGVVCPNCKADMYFGTVPCPDGMPGCCVNHWGYRCFNCGKAYH